MMKKNKGKLVITPDGSKARRFNGDLVDNQGRLRVFHMDKNYRITNQINYHKPENLRYYGTFEK